ncbi:MAG TPA: YecR family lipoprotein [Alphaproteobacteria bacterium]|nr:hypothetical protein [Alphaproteobacteria bacterium]USO06173.1 MAG: hypothetical protein H6859_02970 [Rhodospirillales bacterium]HOO81886.1 YecR family lipoprotein [Alphaproteobacteria bacterium]
MKNFLLLVVIFLSGCAVNKTMYATGGSKADGTVTLSYSYGGFEQPVVDYASALTTAKDKCKAWGYKNAEAFGGESLKCLAYNAYGCTQQQVDVMYQCLDK